MAARKGMRLAIRLILALTAIVVVIEAGLAWFNLQSEQRIVVDQMVRGAEQLSRSITSATWHAMLADHREDVYDILENIGHNPGIESIRIFNKEGRVTFSTDSDAPEWVDKTAEACFLCHAEEEPLARVDVPSRARVFQRPDGHRQLGFVTPIYNEPACSTAACHAHPEDRQVLGVIDVQMDLTPVDASLTGIEHRTKLTTLVEIALIAGFIAFFSHRFVGKPIKRLIGSTQTMGEMDLDQPIDTARAGELSELAASFDGMRVRLKRALDALNESAHDLEHKVEERSRQLTIARQSLIRSDRLASLGQLAASVAHEINNPVAGILNLSMLLQRIMRDDGLPPDRVPDARRYLAQISDETARVGRIVSDLLAFSRRSAPRNAEVDVNAAIRNTVSLLGHKLEHLEVDVELELDPELLAIPGDRSQLQQVLMNLVMNGAEAMPDGGRVVVRTRRDAPTSTAVVEVEDEGTGIPEEHLARVFDPFFTTKDEGKGVGLGLAVVYGIVEAHGGTIDVRTRPGEGTLFTVRLPLVRPSEGEGDEAPAEEATGT